VDVEVVGAGRRPLLLVVAGAPLRTEGAGLIPALTGFAVAVEAVVAAAVVAVTGFVVLAA
jgi:hypothetical protein